MLRAIARRHTAGLAAFVMILGIVAVIPALDAKPAAADRRTTQRCDFDPISGEPFNCRTVTVSHTHPTETPRPSLPTELPCGAPGMPRSTNCDEVDDQLNTGTAPLDDGNDNDGNDNDGNDNDGNDNDGNDNDGNDPVEDPEEEEPEITTPPPVCTGGGLRHRHGGHCHTHEASVPVECNTAYTVHRDGGHYSGTTDACPDPETSHKHPAGQGHTDFQTHTLPDCGPRDATWTQAGHNEETVDACPEGFPTQRHRHPEGSGRHTDLQAHSPDPLCWSVALSSLPGHGHDPIPVPVCPTGWQFCGDTTDGMNPLPPGNACPQLTAAEAVLASTLQQTAAPGWVAQNWNSPGLISHIGAALKSGLLTPAQQKLMRYVQAGIEAAAAERNREHERNPVALLVRPGDPSTIAREVWASLPADARALIAGGAGVVIKISQDQTDALCTASDRVGGLVGAVVGATGLGVLGAQTFGWVSSGTAAVVGTGTTVVGGTVSVAWLYCEFVHAPSGGGASVDSPQGTDETLVVMIPLLLDDSTDEGDDDETPPPTMSVPVTLSTCSDAATLTAADLSSVIEFAGHKAWIDANLGTIERNADGDWVAPTAAIDYVVLSGQRTVAGSLIASVVTDGNGGPSDFTDTHYIWRDDNIVSITLAACPA